MTIEIYFTINLHESMGPGLDRTRDPWICSQTRMIPSKSECQTVNCLYQDQNVGPDLGPNFMQRLSANIGSRLRVCAQYECSIQ